MPKLNPVNPASPIPRPPDPHRDKRRRQSEPTPDDAGPGRRDENETTGAGDDEDHAIDEYV